ncbi:FtsX-like permease family protein [Acetobacterium fimetarium]|uniref:FtsX-like permease family protein n=1 Tax=Acetobacterium fimetarium TaxID=52691 RepID=A0ABR6WX66_9FIRM|nr:ABC transporter permease [Acetobacterium fimetarium]MBC3805217.1 FtsX-like permease family protein [Acetobacterium fimetarium]
MRITAKLAYSQLKINRSRTIGALIAITLATALITAVCSFVASGNAMLVSFLGVNYGEYGNSYVALLFIPAIIFGLIILSLAIIVISNVFRVSAGERVTQFGVLKCVGATKKQIIDTVMYESILLSAIGIPLGILAGLLLTFVGIGVANHFLDDLNSLVHIMINEITLSLSFVVSWKALLLSAAVCFLTVLLSAWLPAHKAAKASAIDCIRGTGEVKIDRKQVRTSPLVERLFGIEGTLAAKNIKRNRRNFRSTVIALAAGVILFISLGELSGQANAIQAYIRLDIDQTVLTEYTSAYDNRINEATGKEETVYIHPISSELGNNIAQKLEEFDHTKIFGIGNDFDTYETVLPEELISAPMQSVLEASDQQNKPELPVEIIVLDDTHYAALCEKAGAPLGSTILLNHYSYNDNGTKVDLVPFSPKMKALTLVKADGSSSEMSIQGVLTQAEMPKELFYPNTNPVRLIVPQAEVRGYSWYSAPSDVPGFITYANDVMAQTFPENTDASYMESGFNTRVYQVDDYMKVMNIAIVLASIFMYSFVVLLMLIGFTNVISTMSTNVRMRSREFAVLQSVGMTTAGLKQMLNLESVLCSMKALIYGLPVGIIVSIFINLPIRSMFPIPYALPWLAIVLCVLAVFLVTWSTTRYAAHRLEKQNIIETIRSESGK